MWKDPKTRHKKKYPSNYIALRLNFQRKFNATRNQDDKQLEDKEQTNYEAGEIVAR
jgi:hypothetical protein